MVHDYTSSDGLCLWTGRLFLLCGLVPWRCCETLLIFPIQYRNPMSNASTTTPGTWQQQCDNSSSATSSVPEDGSHWRASPGGNGREEWFQFSHTCPSTMFSFLYSLLCVHSHNLYFTLTLLSLRMCTDKSFIVK